jgi:predicted subunit of tRNA(5-methylaminomethyl-2-thiouridylate) methyltransferase
MKKHNFQDYKIKQLTDTYAWVDSKNSYEQESENINREIRRLDAIRKENFAQTFPELKQLLLLDKRKMWPV